MAAYQKGLDMQKDPLGARDAFYAATKLAPRFTDAYFNLGNIYRSLNQFKDAESTYKKCIKINPSFVNCHFNLGVTYRSEHNLQKAVKSFQETTRVKPDFARAYSVLGFTLTELNELPAAVSNFKQALRLEPTYDGTYNNYLDCLLQSSLLDDAELIARKYLSLKPSSIDAHVFLSSVLASQGGKKKLSEALELNDKVVRTLVPSSSRGWYEVGSAYTNIKRCNGLDAALDDKDALQQHLADLVTRYNSSHHSGQAWGHSRDFDLIPEAYQFPEQLNLFTKRFKAAAAASTWILKPTRASDARGVSLLKSLKQIPTNSTAWLVQRYISQPLLFSGHKFDMRLFVLVTSVRPLRLYLYEDGVARHCTREYSMNGTLHSNAHITNDNINKGYGISCDDSRVVSGVKASLAKRGLPVDRIWKDIARMLTRAFVGVVAQQYRHGALSSFWKKSPPVAFKLYGADVILDEELRPWLLEVNRAPSFGSSCTNEYQLKQQLIRTVYSMMNAGLRRAVKPSAVPASPQISNKIQHFQHVFKAHHGFEASPDIIKEVAASLEEDSLKGDFNRIYPTADGTELLYAFRDADVSESDLLTLEALAALDEVHPHSDRKSEL